MLQHSKGLPKSYHGETCNILVLLSHKVQMSMPFNCQRHRLGGHCQMLKVNTKPVCAASALKRDPPKTSLNQMIATYPHTFLPCDAAHHIRFSSSCPQNKPHFHFHESILSTKQNSSLCCLNSAQSYLKHHKWIRKLWSQPMIVRPQSGIFADHIAKLVSKATCRLGILRSCKSFLETSALLTVYNGFV